MPNITYTTKYAMIKKYREFVILKKKPTETRPVYFCSFLVVTTFNDTTRSLWPNSIISICLASVYVNHLFSVCHVLLWIILLGKKMLEILYCWRWDFLCQIFENVAESLLEAVLYQKPEYMSGIKTLKVIV